MKVVYVSSGPEIFSAIRDAVCSAKIDRREIDHIEISYDEARELLRHLDPTKDAILAAHAGIKLCWTSATLGEGEARVLGVRVAWPTH